MNLCSCMEVVLVTDYLHCLVFFFSYFLQEHPVWNEMHIHTKPIKHVAAQFYRNEHRCLYTEVSNRLYYTLYTLSSPAAVLPSYWWEKWCRAFSFCPPLIVPLFFFLLRSTWKSFCASGSKLLCRRDFVEKYTHGLCGLEKKKYKVYCLFRFLCVNIRMKAEKCKK